MTRKAENKTTLTYLSYLKVDELLSLQKLKSNPPDHDEMLFIIIHQTYELWFKQLLHEMELLRDSLNRGDTGAGLKTLRRMLVIMKTVVGQTDILETMTPVDFSNFRDFLESASGFESVQFREIELLCGLRSQRFFEAHPEGTEPHQTLLKRQNEQTLWEAFIAFLQHHGYEVNTPKRIYAEGLAYDPDPETQKTLLGILKAGNEITNLCENLVDFDEGLQEWRYRHVKMVERTIGYKQGTGGSSGVDYLKRTLHRQIFPDLWQLRSEL